MISAQEVERLYRATRPVLVLRARAVLRSASQAEDVVQDLFLWIWRRRDTLELRAPLSYLKRAARHRALNALEIQFEKHADLDVAMEVSVPATVMARMEAREELDRVLAPLTPRQRQALLLMKNGFSQEEAMAVMGVGVKTLETHVTRALKSVQGTRRSA